MDFFSIIQIITIVVSLIFSIIAIYQTQKQIKISNEQFLFDRRMKIWLLVKDLLKCQEEAKVLIHKNDKLNANFIIAYLVNCTALQEMANGFEELKESHENHVQWLSKRDWLKQCGEEALFIFAKGKGKMICEYLTQYADLLQAVYKYRITEREQKEFIDKFPMEKVPQGTIKRQKECQQEIIEDYDNLIVLSKDIQTSKINKQIKFITN